MFSGLVICKNGLERPPNQWAIREITEYIEIFYNRQRRSEDNRHLGLQFESCEGRRDNNTSISWQGRDNL